MAIPICHFNNVILALLYIRYANNSTQKLGPPHRSLFKKMGKNFQKRRRRYSIPHPWILRSAINSPFPTFQKKMQTTKSHLLTYSIDPTIRSLYQHSSHREANFRYSNRGSHFLTTAESTVNHELQFPSQTTRQGLGDGRYLTPVHMQSNTH